MSVPDNIDIDREAALFPYFLTLTCQTGFSLPQCEAVVLFHRTAYFVNVILVSEFHDSGEIHYHSLADVRTKQTAKVTSKIERFYAANDIPFVKGVSINVKRATDKVGLLHYLCKDLEEGVLPLVLKGWSWSFIQQQVRDNIKKLPFRMLLKDTYFVTKKNGTEIILRYMSAHKMSCVSKECFYDVVHAMIRDKYRFSSAAIRWCYVEVCVMQGSGNALRSLLDNELFSLS